MDVLEQEMREDGRVRLRDVGRGDQIDHLPDHLNDLTLRAHSRVKSLLARRLHVHESGPEQVPVRKIPVVDGIGHHLVVNRPDVGRRLRVHMVRIGEFQVKAGEFSEPLRLLRRPFRLRAFERLFDLPANS